MMLRCGAGFSQSLGAHASLPNTSKSRRTQEPRFGTFIQEVCIARDIVGKTF